MFAFKKFIAPFLLPPGILIVILILSGLSFLRKSRKAGLLCILVGAALWLLSIGPVSGALMRGLESGLSMPANPRGDVIVLLGGGIYDHVKDLTGTGFPSGDTLARLVTVVRLQKRLNIPVIISGGAVYPWKKAEASVDRRFLVELGVPADKIILEEKSRDTFENAKYVKYICEKRDFRDPILVTSAFHMRRSLMIFRHFNITVTPVPVELRIWKRKYRWPDYLPGDLRAARTACHEYLGLLYYRAVFRIESAGFKL